MKYRALFTKGLSLLLAGLSLWLLSGACQGADTILKVIVSAAKIREKPDIASPVVTTVAMSTLLASQGKEGRWFKVSLPPDGDGRVLSGFIHETVVKVLSSPEDQAAKTLQKPLPEMKPVKEVPVRAEKAGEEPRRAAVEAEPPAGQKKFSFRPYLRAGLLLTPPSANDLGFKSVDANSDLDQFLTVKKGNFGAGLQMFLPLSKNPSLKWGLDFGAQKLFSSRFDLGIQNIPGIYEDYHLESEYEIYLLAIVELTPAGSPFFIQGGAGGHFVKWSYEFNFEGQYDSEHKTGGGMDFNFGLMAAAGTNLRISDGISLPVSIRLEYLARYGALLTAGLVVGFSFR